MNVYVGTNTMKNAYIGEFVPYTPASNTIAYYTFNGNTNDSSSNGYNMTPYNLTYSELSNGKKVVYFSGTESYAKITGLSMTVTEGTMNIWIKKNRSKSSAENYGGLGSYNPYTDGEWSIEALNSNLGNIGHIEYYGSWIFGGSNNTGISNGNWMNICSVVGSSGNKFYVNGQQVSLSYSNGSSSTGFGSRFFTTISIGRHRNAGDNTDAAQGWASEWIIENRQRTTQEIQDYYNNTKSTYGL